MKSRWFTILVLVGVAYLLTWIGGNEAHHRDMARSARRLYAQAEATNQQLVELDRQNGGQTHPQPNCAREDQRSL